MKTGPILVGLLVSTTALMGFAPSAAADGSVCDACFDVGKVRADLPPVFINSVDGGAYVQVAVQQSDTSWLAEVGYSCEGIIEDILYCASQGLPTLDAFRLCVG